MSNRQFALKSKISELMALLDMIQFNGISSVIVHTEANEPRTYSVPGIHAALSNLTSEVISTPDAAIAILEEKYEHDRADVFKIVARLAEISASIAF